MAVVGVSRPAEDLRVCWLATRSVLRGGVEPLERPPVHADVRSDEHRNGHPSYGEASGLHNPKRYRYPPLFPFVFVPFAVLPCSTGHWDWTAANGLMLRALLLALAGNVALHDSKKRALQGQFSKSRERCRWPCKPGSLPTARASASTHKR